MKQYQYHKKSKEQILSLTEKFAIGASINGRNTPLQVCAKADLDSMHKGHGISNNNSLFVIN